MNHQPYESWILDETTLSLAEQRQMKDHLDSCAACRKLATGWIAARRSMRAAPPARPAPGFTGRFQARLAERRALQHQLQARRFVLITSTASISTGTVTFTVTNLSGTAMSYHAAANVVTSKTHSR